MGRKDARISLSDLPPRERRELLGLPPVGETEPKKRHKYGVGKKEDRTCDGVVFDSIREMKRYNELKVMEQAGTILSLELQPKWDLHVCGVKVGTYSADFRYREWVNLDCKPGHPAKLVSVVEDVKGMKTQIYRLKKKMLRAEYGIEIRET